MQYITSRENILLAYRNIKKNKGSKTRGVNRSTILSVAEKDPEALISYVRNRQFHRYCAATFICIRAGYTKLLSLPPFHRDHALHVTDLPRSDNSIPSRFRLSNAELITRQVE